MSDTPDKKKDEISNKKFTEDAIKEIEKIIETKKVGLFEAVVIFCEENDMDTDEFVKKIPYSVVAKIKKSAIVGSFVRKKVYEADHVSPI